MTQEKPDVKFERRIKVNQTDSVLLKIREEYIGVVDKLMEALEKGIAGTDYHRALLKREKHLNWKCQERQMDLGVFIHLKKKP